MVRQTFPDGYNSSGSRTKKVEGQAGGGLWPTICSQKILIVMSMQAILENN